MKAKVLAVGAVTCRVAFGAQAVPAIDLFTLDQTALVDSVFDGNGLSSQVGSPGEITILGGYRDLFVEKLAGAGNTSVVVQGGNLVFSTGLLSKGVARLRWDGPASHASIDSTGLGGIDLATVSTGFSLVVNAANAPFGVQVVAYTDAANYTTLALTVPGTGNHGLSWVNFSSLGTSVGAGFNFSNLGALELSLFGDATVGSAQANALSGGGVGLASPDTVEVSLAMLVAVPEPSVWLQCLVGLAGLALWARRGLARR